MPVYPPTRSRMEEVVSSMRETIRARQQAAPRAVNLAAAESLFEPILMPWKGVEYRIRAMTYREGLQLQRAIMGFERFAREETPDEAAVAEHIQLLDGVLDLYWSFLDPKPRENPFADAMPLEVGAIAGFFLACQRMQNQPSRMAEIRLSPSIT
jgi:hypothetical protein